MIASLPRLGDPAAPRFRSLPRPRIWVAVVVAAVVIFAGFMLASAIAHGDVGRVVGTAVGIAIAVGGLSLLARYWRSVRIALAELTRHHPDAVVIAARFPAVPLTAVEQMWAPSSERLRAQEAALVADHQGLSFFSVRAGVPELLLDIPWAQVRDLIPVEFVESGIAYQGLLLSAMEPRSRLVFQPSLPALPFPTFPMGDRLQELRDRIMRQQHPGTGDEASYADQARSDSDQGLEAAIAEVSGRFGPRAHGHTRGAYALTPVMHNPYLNLPLSGAFVGTSAFLLTKLEELTGWVIIPFAALMGVAGVALLVQSLLRVPSWHRARKVAREYVRQHGGRVPSDLRWFA